MTPRIVLREMCRFGGDDASRACFCRGGQAGVTPRIVLREMCRFGGDDASRACFCRGGQAGVTPRIVLREAALHTFCGDDMHEKNKMRY